MAPPLQLPRPEEVQRLDQTPSVNQVLRQLKRQEVGLYNCINSILTDALFVEEVPPLHPNNHCTLALNRSHPHLSLPQSDNHHPRPSLPQSSNGHPILASLPGR